MSRSIEEGAGEVGPEHEGFRQAVRWIAEHRDEHPSSSLHRLVGEAARRYDLSPKEELSLLALVGSERGVHEGG